MVVASGKPAARCHGRGGDDFAWVLDHNYPVVKDLPALRALPGGRGGTAALDPQRRDAHHTMTGSRRTAWNAFPRLTIRGSDALCDADVDQDDVILEPQPTIFGESGTTRSSAAGLAAARSVRRARATPAFTNRTSFVSPSWFVFPRRPAWGASVRRGVSVASEPPRQLDVEDVEVDVADPLEERGGPGVGQGLWQLVAPGLVLGLQLAELGHGRGPPLRPRRRPGRPRPRRLLDGDAGVAPLAEAALAFGVREGHAAIVALL